MTDEELQHINALVAEAMGFEVIGEYIKVRERVPCPDGNPRCLVAHYGPVLHPLPHYSTDIAAAWQGVEWMREQKWEFALEWSPSDFPGVWWAVFAYYTDDEADYQWASKSAPTVPLAICLAFLKTMGVEVPTPTASS